MRYFVACLVVGSIIQYSSAVLGQQIADSFIYPVKGVSVDNILDNVDDPRNDGWSTANNDFANYCCTCSPPGCYHPGEDWNLDCDMTKAGFQQGNCDEGISVYAAGQGKVIFAEKVDDSLKYGVIIEHVLPNPEDFSQYILPGTGFPPGESTLQTIVRTDYLHLKNLGVVKNQKVAKGEKIGEITNPGGSGSHLHFEVRWGKTIGFPFYKETKQGLTDVGLLIPSAFIAAHTGKKFQPTFTTTCPGPLVGGKETNWQYSCGGEKSWFYAGNTIMILAKIAEISANHIFMIKIFRDGKFLTSWIKYDFNEIEPGTVWETAYFWYELHNALPGSYTFEVLVFVSPALTSENAASITQEQFTSVGTATAIVLPFASVDGPKTCEKKSGDPNCLLAQTSYADGKSVQSYLALPGLSTPMTVTTVVGYDPLGKPYANSNPANFVQTLVGGKVGGNISTVTLSSITPGLWSIFYEATYTGGDGLLHLWDLGKTEFSVYKVLGDETPMCISDAECPIGQNCEDDLCQVIPFCAPTCFGKKCGADSCGGSCGLCSFNQTCNTQTFQCEQKITDPEYLDQDGDGFQGIVDCDDTDPSVYNNAPELCDGKNNDCDNGVDENFGLGDTCDGDDEDLCIKGLVLCNSGTLKPYCWENNHSIETCNQSDDDCDGKTDEGFFSTTACCGLGNCAHCEEALCQSSPMNPGCDPFEDSAPELCNALDDDCDGATDEDFSALGTFCDTADADQCAYGLLQCSKNQTSAVCIGDVQLTPSGAELCDLIDNDCNGQTDEGDICDPPAPTPVPEPEPEEQPQEDPLPTPPSKPKKILCPPDAPSATPCDDGNLCSIRDYCNGPDYGPEKNYCVHGDWLHCSDEDPFSFTQCDCETGQCAVKGSSSKPLLCENDTDCPANGICLGEGICCEQQCKFDTCNMPDGCGSTCDNDFENHLCEEGYCMQGGHCRSVEKVCGTDADCQWTLEAESHCALGAGCISWSGLRPYHCNVDKLPHPTYDCVNTPVAHCDDYNPCTTDICLMDWGCSYTVASHCQNDKSCPCGYRAKESKVCVCPCPDEAMYKSFD